ncbi:MAG: hypothetical protein OHK0047_08890 [Leptolyngbyaceae cyanobacterium]
MLFTGIYDMFKPSLPPDDLPPAEALQSDRALHQQLEEAVNKRFYEACDGVTQALLLNCQWSVTITAEALTLIIHCPDITTNWRVLNNIVAIGSVLAVFSPSARICVCPPPDSGIPLEVRVDEISVYRDLL